MVSFNYTAVAATDLCTKVGHGLLTGAGPAVVPLNIGGLLANTQYWIIRISDDTFKFATSQANALAGTPVNITADHSGFLGVGIPYARAITYAALSQVKSTYLNDLQDSVAARKHGFIVVPLRISPDFISTTSAKWYIDLPVGSVIHGFIFSLFGNGADDLQAVFEKNFKDDTPVATVDGPTNYNNQGAAYTDQVFDVTDSTVTDANQFVLYLIGVGTWAVASHNGNVVLAGTNLKVKSIRMICSKP